MNTDFGTGKWSAATTKTVDVALELGNGRGRKNFEVHKRKA